VIALAVAAAVLAVPNPGPSFSNVANYGPAWSPDGKRIAFAGYAARHAQVYAIDLAARRVVRITHDSANDFSPRWLRDGRIAFLGQDAGENFVAMLDSRGRTVKLKSLGGEAAWSPDGRRVAYTRDDPNIPEKQLWVAAADGSAPRMIVANAGRDGAEPDWSPDGTRIAYVAGANLENGRTIHVVGADGIGDVEITQGGHEWFPRWSPDGKRIVFAEGPFLQHRYSLSLVNADGTGEHALTAPNERWDDTLPAWSPDGRTIAFTSSRGGANEIWTMRPDGTGLRRVTYGGCTIIGTDGPDVLTGGPGRDVICGFGGDDVLRGGGGDDLLVGGQGNDRLEGGAGNDVLDGEQGNDLLVAGAGVDAVYGGPGFDTAYADSHDTLHDVERHFGGRVYVAAPPPSAAGIERKTRSAAAESGARVVSLVVRGPERFSIRVEVDDAPAYLRHRANTLIDGIFAASRRVRWQSFELVVADAQGAAFSYAFAGNRTTWTIRSGLSNCANGLDLDIEVIDNPDPPCPAP
jgi:Tol biopolymer transport system component